MQDEVDPTIRNQLLEEINNQLASKPLTETQLEELLEHEYRLPKLSSDEKFGKDFQRFFIPTFVETNIK